MAVPDEIRKKKAWVNSGQNFEAQFKIIFSGGCELILYAFIPNGKSKFKMMKKGMNRIWLGQEPQWNDRSAAKMYQAWITHVQTVVPKGTVVTIKCPDIPMFFKFLPYTVL